MPAALPAASFPASPAAVAKLHSLEVSHAAHTVLQGSRLHAGPVARVRAGQKRPKLYEALESNLYWALLCRFSEGSRARPHHRLAERKAGLAPSKAEPSAPSIVWKDSA